MATAALKTKNRYEDASLELVPPDHGTYGYLGWLNQADSQLVAARRLSALRLSAANRRSACGKE